MEIGKFISKALFSSSNHVMCQYPSDTPKRATVRVKRLSMKDRSFVEYQYYCDDAWSHLQSSRSKHLYEFDSYLSDEIHLDNIHSFYIGDFLN